MGWRRIFPGVPRILSPHLNLTCGEIYESAPRVRIQASSPMKTAHSQDLREPRMQSEGQLLTVLVSDLLHIDIAHALNEVLHGSRRFTESSGADLSLCACKAVPKEVREFHRYWPSDIHPKFQFLLASLTFCPSLVCVTERDLTSCPILVHVVQHVPKGFPITRGPHPTDLRIIQ
jgi:hypothetical protein